MTISKRTFIQKNMESNIFLYKSNIITSYFLEKKLVILLSYFKSNIKLLYNLASYKVTSYPQLCS